MVIFIMALFLLLFILISGIFF